MREQQQKLAEKEEHSEDVINGFEIVHGALEAPIRQILANAGFDENDTALIINNIIEGEEGFNAKTMQYENLIESGVVDPVKVVCTSLKNAASVASIVILTGGVLIDTE